MRNVAGGQVVRTCEQGGGGRWVGRRGPVGCGLWAAGCGLCALRCRLWAGVGMDRGYGHAPSTQAHTHTHLYTPIHTHTHAQTNIQIIFNEA